MNVLARLPASALWSGSMRSEGSTASCHPDALQRSAYEFAPSVNLIAGARSGRLSYRNAPDDLAEVSVADLESV